MKRLRTNDRNKVPLVSIIAIAAIFLVLMPIGMSQNATPAAQPVDAGPLVGNQSAFAQEVACMAQAVKDPSNNMLNYWPAIGAPEHTDSIHSGVNPCAMFTGSFDGENQVYYHKSASNFSNVQFIVFDGPNGAYLQGGGLGVPPLGQFVSKFNPSTGEEIWRTYLQNAYVNGQWIAAGSMGIIKDGTIIAAAGPYLWKLNRSTGDILAFNEMPVLGSPSVDANLDGFHVAPDEKGTILMKTQNRPVGCPTQGNGAMSSCQAEYGPQPPTTVIAADPETLEVLDAIELEQQVTARPVVTKHNGIIYMYMAGINTLQRVIWNPATKKLTVDKSWAPEYLLPDQTTGSAPGVLGNWVISNTNAQPANTTMSVVAVNQDDSTKLMRINPWGTTLPEGTPRSETVGSFGIDPENNMIYAQDWFVGGVFGISLDQATGEMEVVWSRPDWRTSDYFSLIGPADQRVVISQYINPDFNLADVAGYNYTESVIWANAMTGETIAQSGYTPSTAVGSLANVGYGGRVYMMGNDGSIFMYQVMPATNSTATGSP
jgi:hypothetical protein